MGFQRFFSFLSMTFSIILLLIIIGNNVVVVQSARILGVFPPPARSHYILASSLMRGLAERGHDVTVISPFGETKNPPKNCSYRDIVLKGVLEKTLVHLNRSFDNQDMHPIFKMPLILPTFLDITEALFLDEQVQQLLKSGEKFDVVIVEQFMNEAHKALAQFFDAPLILFSSFGTNSWINPLVGNPQPLAYIPEFMLSYGSHMDFWQRLNNVITWSFNRMLHSFYVYPKNKEMVQKYLPQVDFDRALYSTSLVLLNSHPSTNQPVPNTPNMIEIGGFHVKPAGTLPRDLQDFLDSANEHGVIYFSLGSNLKSAQLPQEKRDAILRVFASLKQRILWKWEDENLPGKTENVKISKWFPQQDILAHPNIRIFITHGGLLSTTETIYHGVPTLAIPIFGDQKLNAHNLVKNQVGLMINYQELDEETLRGKLQELLKNPMYKKNAEMRSRVFHDRSVSPMETALYWVDFVARYKGAPHLRVAALDLGWCHYHLVDVVGVLLGIATILLYCTYKFWALVLGKMIRKKKKNEVKSKMKKH